jgi:hypothetical protein
MAPKSADVPDKGDNLVILILFCASVAREIDNQLAELVRVARTLGML